jgi:XTP/dITP diphosphohydrolase
MNKLIFATNNLNKVIEVRSLLGNSFKILSLSEAGINIEIPEPFDTLKKNAIEKAEVIYNLKGMSCFAEDTGLEVEALNGEPGVKSARYAGDEKSFENNINKLLIPLRL